MIVEFATPNFAINKQRAQARACALTSSRPVDRCSADGLLRLQGFDVVGKVRHPLLHFTLVSTAHIPKQ